MITIHIIVPDATRAAFASVTEGDADADPSRAATGMAAARNRLLARETELTRDPGEVRAERRPLPMAEIKKEYVF